LEELLKLVINSLDSKNNHNRNQICMHLLHEFRSNRNLSLINLNLFNENNSSISSSNNNNNNKNNTDKLFRRVKIRCKCCNKIENSFNSLKNHLTSIKHIFIRKSLIYLKFLQQKCNKIKRSNMYYIRCNICEFSAKFTRHETLLKHLNTKIHLNKCLKLIYQQIRLNSSGSSNSSSIINIMCKSKSNSTKVLSENLSFKINNLIKVVFILVVKKVNLIDKNLNEYPRITTTNNESKKKSKLVINITVILNVHILFHFRFFFFLKKICVFFSSRCYCSHNCYWCN